MSDISPERQVLLDKYAPLIEKYREINVDNSDWHEYVEEDWKARLKECGIEMEKMYFSGVCSQGDGACFEGNVENLGAFMRAHKLSASYPMMGEAAENGINFCLASWEHEGHYYHERSLRFAHTDAEAEDFLQSTYDMQLLGEMGEAIIDKFDKERAVVSDAIEDIVRGYCGDIYSALMAEYEYLTSADAVFETLEANDMLDEQENDNEETD